MEAMPDKVRYIQVKSNEEYNNNKHLGNFFPAGDFFADNIYWE